MNCIFFEFFEFFFSELIEFSFSTFISFPTHSQFYPEVIAILAFLSDLLGDIKKCYNTMEMPLKCCDRLLNDEFTQLFSAETLRNYTSYDPDHESLMDNDSEARMIDRFIAIKMKMPTVTANQLAEKAVKLLESNEKLRENLVETDIQKCFASMGQQVCEKEKELQDLHVILNEKRTHLKMVMLKHDERLAELRTKQTQYDDLMEAIQNQQYTTLDIKQMMAKETTVKGSMAMLKEEVDAIKVQAADAQVKLARVQKVKFDKIKEFNERTFNIVQKLMETSAFRKINVNDLTIDPAATVRQIQMVCMHLKLLKESCVAAKRQYNQQTQQNCDEMTAYAAELMQLNEKYANDMATFQEASKKLDDMNQQCTNFKSDGSNDASRMQRGIDEQIAYKKLLNAEIDDLKMKKTKMEAENVELFNVGERKAQEMIRAKRSAVKQLDQLSDFIDDFLGDDNDNDDGADNDGMDDVAGGSNS